MTDSGISAIFCDYGGVLTPFTPKLLSSERKAAAAAGIDPKTLHQELWRGVSEAEGVIARCLRGEVPLAAVVAERQQVLAEMNVDLDAGAMVWRTIERPVIPGMVDLIRHAKTAGYRTVLTSNQYQEFVPVVASKLQLSKLFDDVVFSCDPDVAVQKPDPSFFELALRRNQLSAGEVLVVDDAPANIEAAKGLGLQTLLVTDHLKAFRALVGLLPGVPSGRFVLEEVGSVAEGDQPGGPGLFLDGPGN